MTYNLTNLTDSTNLAAYLSAANDLTSGWLAIILLGTVGVIVFLNFSQRYDAPTSFAGTAATNLILTGFMFALDLVGGSMVWWSIALAAVGGILMVRGGPIGT